MFIDDTIAAIATAPGEGGIGIIRISGSKALPVAKEIFESVSGKQITDYNTRTLIYGHILDGDKKIDEVLLELSKEKVTDKDMEVTKPSLKEKLAKAKDKQLSLEKTREKAINKTKGELEQV